MTTKAAAYCFLPSITAIKFIASLGVARVLFLTKLFGVTTSDAERYLDMDDAYAEEIVGHVLTMQAKARPISVGRCAAEPTRKASVSGRVRSPGRDGRARSRRLGRASPGAFSPNPAAIPRRSASAILTRR